MAWARRASVWDRGMGRSGTWTWHARGEVARAGSRAGPNNGRKDAPRDTNALTEDVTWDW
jgi:hypothetical protein